MVSLLNPDGSIPGFSLTTLGVGTNTPYIVPQTTSTQSPTPTSTSTVTQPSSPTPTSSTPQSSGGNFMDYYIGWDANQAQQDFQNVFGGDINKLMTARGVNTSGSVDPYDSIRNGISSGYDSYINQLNDMLNNGLPTQSGNMETIVNNQFETAENTLNTDMENGLTDLGTEKTNVNKNQNKNLKDLSENLRNMFMSGNVYLGSRGAGDSSAANQYSYALTKLGNKSRGDVMSQTSTILAEIGGRETKLKNTVKTALENLATEKNNKILEISTWLSEQQNLIKDRIGQAGLSKSTDLANLNTKILDQALAMLQTVQQNNANRISQLDTWAMNQSTTLSQLKANLAGVAAYTPNMPRANLLSGTPSISGGNNSTPIKWSTNYTKDDENKGLFG